MLRGPFLTLPNLITLARIPLALGAMTCVVQGPRLAAQLLMFAAFATDALDGAIARRMGSTSQWGRVLDPVADKLIFALLGGSMAWLGLVPWWLVSRTACTDRPSSPKVIGGLTTLEIEAVVTCENRASARLN